MAYERSADYNTNRQRRESHTCKAGREICWCVGWTFWCSGCRSWRPWCTALDNAVDIEHRRCC